MSNPNILEPLPDDGTRGARLEIDEFLVDNEMTNLFLIALWSLQQKSLDHVNGQPNWMNFYAIAGIHGNPQEDWAGINKPAINKAGQTWVGYCHHSLNTFPTWHRPYMFLFESAVWQEMVRQAERYPDPNDKATYAKAAARFRIPFWDMVMPRNERAPGGRSDSIWACPQIFKVKTVTVKLPIPTSAAVNGWDQISNPLWSFVFPTQGEFDQSGRVPLNMSSSTYNTTETSRVPTNTGQPSVQYLDLAVQRQASARATMLWQMLNPDVTVQDFSGGSPVGSVKINDVRDWDQFATRAMGDTVTVQGRDQQNFSFSMPSLESWHDGIHVLVGTGQYYDPTGDSRFKTGSDGVPQNFSSKQGQMGNPAWAAFDPIFFFHHCNIDRLLAIYQAIYNGSDKYLDPTTAAMELQPFLAPQGLTKNQFWTSGDPYVKNYWNAGFQVPGNKQPDRSVDPDTLRRTLIKYLSDTYYWATNAIPDPSSLPDWPKDLRHSWALNGPPEARVTRALVQQSSTVKIQNGAPQLFSREVNFSKPAETAQATIPFHVTETAIHSDRVLKATNAVDSHLPKGAIVKPRSAGRSPFQFTWNAHVKVRKYAFDGSFSVHLFVGWVKDEQPERYMTKKNEAGFTGVFARGSADVEHCSNCIQHQRRDIIVDDVVPLTTTLYDYLDARDGSETLIRDGDIKTIRDLTPDAVVPFLTEHLRWRIIDLAANMLAGQEQRAGLEISVSSRPFIPPTAGNLMGVYGPETVYPIITNQKPGGFGYVY